MMLDMTQLEEYDKWFAQWRFPIYFPYQHTIWQYSSTGKVNGISGDVDMNIGLFNYGG
jgi:GH25 family lysozyme M1 (1,4-beta-N-acetylmuramidase)